MDQSETLTETLQPGPQFIPLTLGYLAERVYSLAEYQRYRDPALAIQAYAVVVQALEAAYHREAAR